MDIRILFLFFAIFAIATTAFSMGSKAAFWHEGSAQITWPKAGTLIDGEAKNELVYDFHPSLDGHHLRIYVDGEPPVVVREWRGSYTLPLLGMGRHVICIKETNAMRSMTGLSKCVTVVAK